MESESETCRQYVIPKLKQAGWDSDRVVEQKTFTDGRIIASGSKVYRKKQKRADYLLSYAPDVTLAVVEAKSAYKLPSDGLQQAKEYAKFLGLHFAYATNGHGIVEYDFDTGQEREVASFPTPGGLWDRLRGTTMLHDKAVQKAILTPTFHMSDKPLRYYQEIAVNSAVQAIVHGQKRVLLTMATGTGKTLVAFQICWKLWNARWNTTGEHRRPRILYLADRQVLVDDPKDKMFAPFGDARHRIEGGDASKSREMYFSTYQAIARDERRPGLYKEYAPDFFDLVIVDECHRGSASDESNWREILEHFTSAHHLGMTATPRREDNRDTYEYFGDPVYQYSLRQGIEDGFLAPYRVRRIVTTLDATGYTPSPGERDRSGKLIPARTYVTPDFERTLVAAQRTRAIARHLTDFLKKTDRMAKTIVFCVDQEHADAMRRDLTNLNSDMMRQNPDYVCRITADEGEIGRGHLSKFQEVETDVASPGPVIVTTSQLLSTGIDIPTCKVIAIARVINSIVEFKQIIGRGSRVRDDYDKLYFYILDYTGSASLHFADPEFDGWPAQSIHEWVDGEGNTVSETEEAMPDESGDQEPAQAIAPERVVAQGRARKYYVDGGSVEIAADIVSELDAEGNALRVVTLTDYTAEKVRTLYRSAADLRRDWAVPESRREIIQRLEERGIRFADLAEATQQPDADPFDLLCHVAFNAPLRTRRERVDHLHRNHKDFLSRFSPAARSVLEDLLEKYAEHGTAQFALPDVLKVPPLSARGSVPEIIALFGSATKLHTAVDQLQTYLYAA
jgi:type I restriction enzyme R subunit